MEGELGYVVAVDFVVVDFGDAGGAEIPFFWKLVRFCLVEGVEQQVS